MTRNAFYLLALALFALDQATKAWLRHAVPLGATIPLWPDVFHITYTQNRGAAFSLLQGATPLLAATACLVIVGLIYAQRKAGPRMPLSLALALALPLGGALGNLTDRLWLGFVTDMFDFRLINFPVFNVADSAITVGIAILAWRTITAREDAQPASTAGKDLPAS